MTSSFEKPNTNASDRSTSTMSIDSPMASDSSVVSSSPPNPAPSTTTRDLISAPDRHPGLRHVPHVRLRRAPALRVDLLRLLVRDRAGDDHVLAGFPVHRRRHLVVRRELERVDDAQHLVEVAA